MIKFHKYFHLKVRKSVRNLHHLHHNLWWLLEVDKFVIGEVVLKLSSVKIIDYAGRAGNSAGVQDQSFSSLPKNQT